MYAPLDARDILRTHREQNIRQSQKVVDLWDFVLKDSIDKLGDESMSLFVKYSVMQYYSLTLSVHSYSLLQNTLFGNKSVFAAWTVIVSTLQMNVYVSCQTNFRTVAEFVCWKNLR